MKGHFKKFIVFISYYKRGAKVHTFVKTIAAAAGGVIFEVLLQGLFRKGKNALNNLDDDVFGDKAVDNTSHGNTASKYVLPCESLVPVLRMCSLTLGFVLSGIRWEYVIIYCFYV
ncbi:hypothetical protein [Bartonella sp. B1099]|uniref:hypothetical protein n=1 Tax=Bartonella sp. B1099 TaxID=2911422 RepID=UPI0020C20580|nr:hypothetical protein [Bartonella sp. B1099]